MLAEFLTSAVKESQYPPPDRPEVAFAGRSNVGKSSLINALLQRRGLAKTSGTPGRTQLINFFNVGPALRFVDLPGYGFARVPHQVQRTWQPMIETYLRTRHNLKAVILILDIRRDPGPGDLDLMAWLQRYGRPCLPVLTKADKLSRQQASTRSRLIAAGLPPLSQAPVLFSARTGFGREDLWNSINHLLPDGSR